MSLAEANYIIIIIFIITVIQIEREWQDAEANLCVSLRKWSDRRRKEKRKRRSIIHRILHEKSGLSLLTCGPLYKCVLCFVSHYKALKFAPVTDNLGSDAKDHVVRSANWNSVDVNAGTLRTREKACHQDRVSRGKILDLITQHIGNISQRQTTYVKPSFALEREWNRRR
jgi:hypothetical protein